VELLRGKISKENSMKKHSHSPLDDRSLTIILNGLSGRMSSKEKIEREKVRVGSELVN